MSTATPPHRCDFAYGATQGPRGSRRSRFARDRRTAKSVQCADFAHTLSRRVPAFPEAGFFTSERFHTSMRAICGTWRLTPRCLASAVSHRAAQCRTGLSRNSSTGIPSPPTSSWRVGLNASAPSSLELCSAQKPHASGAGISGTPTGRPRRSARGRRACTRSNTGGLGSCRQEFRI